MRQILSASFLFFVLFLVSCEDCKDCLEYDNEPFVRIRFFQKSNLAPVDVAILEINNLNGADIIWYQDTTHEFVLPLSMNQDESPIVITYAYPTDSTIYSDSLNISYQRKLEQTIENFMQVNLYFTQINEYSFDSVNLVCKDALETCKSNDAIVNIYF